MTEIIRPGTKAVGGAVYGDEGKGKFTDYLANEFHNKNIPLTVFRVNGGANAGHTLEFDGKRTALHQLPCGLFIEDTTVVLGKGMVLHPADLVEEINSAKEISNNKIPSSIKINSKAALALDTHRADEILLKKYRTGSSGATGRGIAPAYSDILLRETLRMEDLIKQNWKEKFSKHYDYYERKLSGFGENLAEMKVASLNHDPIEVGNKEEFLNRLAKAREILAPLTEDVYDYVKETWKDENNAYIFEMAQASGLDLHYGVYPDITASDTTFNCINTSTEGIVDYREIQNRISTLKATYMSSVGSRVLPTLIKGEFAEKIRHDAKEYGASTGRPRDIAWLDLPALRFFNKVSGANEIGITHMDIVYPNTPIKVCVAYEINGKKVDYRPYQDWLDQVTPIYIDIPTWDQGRINLATTFDQIPQQAKDYIDLIEREIGSPVTILGNGPSREQIITR